MEKITESTFGKFNGFKVESLDSIKGGMLDKLVETGGGSRINGGYWEVWDNDTTYIFSNGNPPLTSYEISHKHELLASL